MRAVTLKAAGAAVADLIGYYANLAQDQLRRDGVARGPVDYYLDPAEPPGRWWGSGCASVGLDGEVLPEQLQALLEGRHPATEAALGRRFGDRSARGFDATFSAAKSVSVLWALSTDPWVRAEVAAAHDAAVDAALGWLERHGAVTRRGRDGVAQVDTRGLVVALFRQHTSRTADPQLHTHAVIWAKVQDPTGRWLALDARFLKYQQRSIGWVYDAALRAELSARLGVAWGAVIDGHADIVGIPDGLVAEFSQRSTQVDDKLRELVARWAAEHDGVDPDARTVARLERKAVVASRPDKQAALDADALRAQWRSRAAALGFDGLSVPSTRPELPGLAHVDRATVIAEAMTRVGQQGATWLQADLAREIATLLPADGASSGGQLVELVDELAAEAAGRCLGLHPPARGVVARRFDGRPVTEHVTDRRLTTRAILDEEAALLRWARQAVGAVPTAAVADAQAAAARAVAGTHRLVLVVGPAGAGKTTMLRAGIAGLHAGGRTAVRWRRQVRRPTCSPARPAAPQPPWPDSSTAKPTPIGHPPCRRAPPWSWTRPAWPPPRTSPCSFAWPISGSGASCASAIPTSCQRWAAVACSPTGATPSTPTTSTRSAASPSPGKPPPAWGCDAATPRPPRPTPPTGASRQSTPRSSPRASPASTRPSTGEANRWASPAPPPPRPEPST